MNKKEYIEIAGIKVEKNKKYILPKDADEFTRASWLIMGRIKPETESEERLVKEAKEMMDKGITVEIPFN
jgi:hypothetical protein